MAPERIAHGVVEIEVNDRDARARLHEIERDFEKTMREIDRQEADVKIDGDLSPLQKAVKEAQAEVRRLEGEKAEIELGVRKGDMAKLKKDLTAAKREVKRLDGEKAVVEVVVEGEKEALATNRRIEDATRKRQEAIRKRDLEQERLAEKIYKANMKRVNDEARVRESLNRQRLRELSNDEKHAYQIEKERNEVPKLEAAYGRLTGKLEELARARRKARGNDRAVHLIDLDRQVALRDLENLRNEIRRRVGRDPIHLDIIPSFGERGGRALRTHFMATGSISGMIARSGAELGQNMGRAMSRGFRKTAEDGVLTTIRNVTRGAARAGGGQVLGVFTKIGHAIAGLQNMTVRLGPFTTTIRGLIISMTVLGPMIVDIVGALGALVAQVGAATVGVGALGAGFLGGAIPAALGFGLVLKGVVGDLQNVQKAQKAYDDAVRKDSDQVEKKLHELQATMGNVSEATAKTWTQWKGLKKEWKTATSPARGSVFTAIAEGIRTAQALMPRFAKQTNETMSVAEKATTRWQKALRSDEGQRILFTMMRNFRKTLGPVLDGLGNMVAYLGRVGEIASREMPHLAREFRDWSESINSVRTDQLTERVHHVIDSAKTLARWFMSAGRLIKAFFGGGREEGDKFVQTMTNAMDRWTAFLNTERGQNRLQTFFRESVKGTQALYSLLAPLITSFIQWASAVAPLSRDFFKFAGAVAQLAQGFLSITALRGPLAAVATTLGVIWGVGKIGKGIDAIAGFTRALLGMTAAEEGLAVATTEATAAQAAQTAAAKGGGLTRGAGILGNLLGGKGGKLGLMGGLKAAGLLGAGVAVVDGLVNGLQSAAQRSGTNSKLLAIGEDLGHSLTFGLVKSAKEKSAEAFAAAQKIIASGHGHDAPRRVGPIKLGLASDDLTKDQKEAVGRMQHIYDVMKAFTKSHHLPPFRVRFEADPRDFATMDRNFNRLENNLASGLKSINGIVDQNIRAIAQTLGLHSKDGANAVRKNMQLAANAINNNMKSGRVNATDGMRAIRRTFVTNSKASKETTETNFQAAKRAIQQAVQDGVISSKRGVAEIQKLWASALKVYGFTPEQARNIASTKTGSITGGGGNEGGVTIKSGVQKAVGGWIGQPGQAGPDRVPAMLGVGEAVLNRHQQVPVEAALRAAYGYGLDGLFDRVNRPHSHARGGYVQHFAQGGKAGGLFGLAESLIRQGYSVGENSVLHARDPRIGPVTTSRHKHYGASDHYHGGALDVNYDNAPGGEKRALDALAAKLKAAGWHFLWQVADHFDHLHVDIGAGGAAVGAAFAKKATIKRVQAKKGRGVVSTLAQKALDGIHGAAQANLDAVYDSMVTETGGNGTGAGRGAAPAQVRAWAQAALAHEHRLTMPNLSALVGRIMQESTGDPHAVNNWDINAKRGDPSKGLAQVIGSNFAKYRAKDLPNNIFNPVANLVAAIRYMIAQYGHIVGPSGSGYARGGMVKSLVGEAGPEWIVDMMKRTAQKVSGPAIAAIGPQHAVVPTTGKNKARGADILGKIAGSLGMPAFAGGKAPDPKKVFQFGKAPTTTNRPVHGKGRNKLNLTDYGKFRAEKRAARQVKANMVPNKANIPEVDAVTRLESLRAGQEKSINRATDQLQEPDTFLVKTGEDFFGNDIMDIDQGVVSKWRNDLEYVQALWKQMMDTIRNELIAIQQARAAIKAAIASAKSNLSIIHMMQAASEAIIGGKHTSTSEKQAERAKLSAYRDAESQQNKILGGAQESRSKINDLEPNVQEARVEADDNYWAYAEKVTAVDALAKKELAASIPEPPDAVDPYDLALAKAESEGDIAGQIAAYEGKLQQAQGMLSDNNPYNDIDAYNAITSAKSSITSLKEQQAGGAGGSADTGPSFAVQSMALSAARSDLYKSFGSNFALGSSLAGASMSPLGYGAYGLNPAAGGTTTNVVNNNYFPTPPPDPHTWSQGVAWELQAAI